MSSPSARSRRAALSPRAVFGPYTRLFAVPGAGLFSFAGWLARLPGSTMGLGTVLLISSRSGSYGLAGAVSGTFALAFAVASPLWARAADRRGQSAVLRRSMGAFLVLGLAFLAAVLAGGPAWSWFVLAAATGAAGPNVGSMVRARWTHALPDARQRQTAFAFESVVDEVVFVVGPPVVTVLAALVAPVAGFLTGLVLGAGGGMWLGRQAATEPPAHAVEPAARRGRRPAVPTAALMVAVPFAAMGTVFGAMEVVVVGFARLHDRPAVAGVALAVYAAGSLVAGLVYGLLHLPGTLAARFAGCALLFGVAAQLLFAVRSLTVLVPVVFLAGLTIAPVLVSGMSLVESRVPRSALTEALTWTTTGLTAGVTVGAALAGVAVDEWGARAAFAVPAAGAALAGLLAVVGTPVLRRENAAPANDVESDEAGVDIR